MRAGAGTFLNWREGTGWGFGKGTGRIENRELGMGDIGSGMKLTKWVSSL